MTRLRKIKDRLDVFGFNVVESSDVPPGEVWIRPYKETTADRIADAVVDVLNDTRGFHVDALDEEIQWEFVDRLREAIDNVLKESGGGLNAGV